MRCMFHSGTRQPTHLTQLGCKRIEALMKSGSHLQMVEGHRPRTRPRQNKNGIVYGGSRRWEGDDLAGSAAVGPPPKQDDGPLEPLTQAPGDDSVIRQGR
jgi:hypothetical protein